MSHHASPPRLSLEELGLFNILASIEKEQEIDPFLLQGLLSRGFIAGAGPYSLTTDGEAMLRSLATRLEAEALGDNTSVRTPWSTPDPLTSREVSR